MVNIIGYIYVTTGIKRSFFYIGKHVSDSFDPTYFGSGIKLRSYINKYKNDFTNVSDLVRTKIIYRANSIEELNLMETLFIKAGKQYSGDKECWNIASGGDGGNTLLYMNEEERKAFCEKSRGSNNGMYNKGFLIAGEKNGMFGIKRTEEYIEKHLSGGKNPMFGKGYKISGDKNGMFGKKHSKKSKDKMSEKRKGERNPRSKTIKVIFDDGRVEEYKTMKEVIEIFSISRPTLINYLKYKKHYKKHKCVFYIDEGRGG